MTTHRSPRIEIPHFNCAIEAWSSQQVSTIRLEAAVKYGLNMCLTHTTSETVHILIEYKLYEFLFDKIKRTSKCSTFKCSTLTTSESLHNSDTIHICHIHRDVINMIKSNLFSEINPFPFLNAIHANATILKRAHNLSSRCLMRLYNRFAGHIRLAVLRRGEHM